MIGWHTNQYLQRNHVDCLKFLLFFKISFLILDVKQEREKGQKSCETDLKAGIELCCGRRLNQRPDGTFPFQDRYGSGANKRNPCCLRENGWLLFCQRNRELLGGGIRNRFEKYPSHLRVVP